MEAGKYNKEWFEKRALNSLRNIGKNLWDYSDSLLNYVFSSAEEYESIQETDTPYFKLVTKPEHEYLKSIAKNIAEILPNNFEYIDLGPGTEHKEQFLFDELKKQGREFTYIPVDINDHFLDLAENHASKQGIKTRKIKASFEELPEVLGRPTLPRVVSIGLTFVNYDPQEILKLLSNIAGKNGYLFINAQISDRVDMALLKNIYQEDTKALFDEKLKLIGLDPNSDIIERTTDDGIKLWCKILNSNKTLEKLGIFKNDKLMIFQSLRYTKEQLKSELEKTGNKYILFDTRTSFIASVIKT